MSLLDTASLIVTPNAYKEGKLYSVIPSDGSGDLSVTRATTATRVNSAGLVELVPYNLVSYSEQFNNATWTKVGGATISANTIIAPNGTLTADTLTIPSPSVKTYIVQNITSAVQCSASIYLKKITGSTATKVRISFNNQVAWNTGKSVVVDLTDDWQRVEIPECLLTLATGVRFFIGNLTASDTIDTSITGGNIAIWGAQLVEGTEAKDYYPTETRLNIPRLDYSLGSCPSILVEPQRTNIVTYSEQFNDVSWTKNLGGVGGVPVVTSNAGISPSGITNADRIQFTLNGGTTTADISDIRKLITTTAGTYTFSFWVKSFDGVSSYQMLVRDPNGITNQMVVTGEWQRYTITAATYPTGNASMGFGIRGGQTPINSGTADILVWGAQLEAGAYATSYIPTTSASVTRNVDILQRTNVYTNGWITASGGTWYGEIKNNKALIRDASSYSFALKNASAFHNGIYLRQATGGTQRLAIVPYSAGVGVPSGSAYTTLTDTVKFAAKWDGTNYNLFVNGVKVVSSIPYTQTLFEFLECPSGRDIPLYINAMALFPSPLTDDQCIALTTI